MRDVAGDQVLGGRAGRGDRVPRDAQGQGQVVAGAGRNHGQRRRRPRDRLESGVRGAVPTDGDHRTRSGGHRLGGQFLGLGTRGGRQDVGSQPAGPEGVEHGAGQGAGATATRGGADQHGDVQQSILLYVCLVQLVFCCPVTEREHRQLARRAPSPVHSAHVGEELEVHYRWHPYFGCKVGVRRVEQRATGRFLKVQGPTGVVVSIAGWMLDPVVCAGMIIGPPQVDLSALVDLQRLFMRTANPAHSRSDVGIVREEGNEASQVAGDRPRADR